MKSKYEFPLQVNAKGAELGYEPDKLAPRFLVPLIQVGWPEGKDPLLFWFDESQTDPLFEGSIDDLRARLDIPANQEARLRSMLEFRKVQGGQAAGDIGVLRLGLNIRREEIARFNTSTNPWVWLRSKFIKFAEND